VDEPVDDTLGPFLLQTLRSQVARRGEAAFMVYAAPDSCLDTLGPILEAGQTVRARRQHFVFKELRNDWRALNPEGFSVRLVQPSLLADTSLRNLDDLKEEILSERQSLEEFLRESFGLCSIHGDEIVGWCLSEYNGPGSCEIGIGVNRAYRKRGIATTLASAFVEEALSRGISHIGWHSFASNKASVAAARKTGFQKANDYSVYVVRFKRLEHPDAQRDSQPQG
jgi:RimJ/RimL family protein N-acetyltransferase